MRTREHSTDHDAHLLPLKILPREVSARI